MSEKISIHVSPNINKGWSVRKTGSLRALRNFDSKTEAIKYAKGINKKLNQNLVIHTPDGWVEKKYYADNN